jgi:hypothetical protein
MQYPLPILVLAATLMAANAQPAGNATSAQPADASTTASGGSAADQARAAAIRQYRHDLVNVVALRADPDYLVGAAILALPFRNQTPGLDFDALSTRAAAAPDAGPAAHWIRLGLCKIKTGCPKAHAFAYLKQHAADNAAVWLIDMDYATTDGARKAALKRAATARYYDGYGGEILADVVKAVSVLPPLPDTTAGADHGQPDNPDGVRALVALTSVQAANAGPGFAPLDRICRKDGTDKDSDVRAECLQLAHTLQWGSSPIARATGLRIQGELEPGAEAQTDPARRDLAWQLRQYGKLLKRSLTDPKLASQWLARARNGGTELSLILATLRANDVPTDAPPSFDASAAPAASTPAPAGSGG